MTRALAAACLAAALLPASAASARVPSFSPSDPLAARQWHLAATHVFDRWSLPPVLPAVRVAVIDSGVDASHPDLAGRIVAARSFVGGRATRDESGHGTFVAGLIAANVENGEGIAGMALSARLVVAKVVAPDGGIPLGAEVRAIRWAADSGARVINLSFGGLRDPADAERDTYSPLEAAAIAYAERKGALVVAAVGNATDSPRRPWPYANYPAALPHVLGVGATGRSGNASAFSNRDSSFLDIAAPGEAIVSTLPRGLTADRPGCVEQGYSPCGETDYRRGRGTSFASPQVTAGAAQLLAVRPRLTASQLSWTLTRSATDASPASGCPSCRAGRDALTGWGRLDVAAAIARVEAGGVVVPDALEPNDDAGAGSRTLWGRAPRTLHPTLDFWDDPSDVYRVRADAGARLAVTIAGLPGARLALWRPGTERIAASTRRAFRVAQSAPSATVQRLAYSVQSGRGGWYYVQAVQARPGAGPYTLSLGRR
jgi:subtilisin family serine protease